MSIGFVSLLVTLYSCVFQCSVRACMIADVCAHDEETCLHMWLYTLYR
jgi:hypothetical protein